MTRREDQARSPFLRSLVVAAAAVLVGPALTSQQVGTLHAQEAASRSQIVGAVVSSSGEPVPGATILAKGTRVPEPRRTQTGAEGEFALRSLPAGSYEVTIRAYGYAEQTRSVDAGAGQSRHLEVTLRPAPVQLRDLEVTTATRTLTSAREVPAAVTVVSRDEIEEQSTLTTDIGQILGQTVPGLAPGTQSSSNFGQTLRGRNLHVMVDGIPVSTPLRNGQRALHSVDPSAIERVEVVRGATAAYGYGGTGGAINIITRDAGAQQNDLRTEVQLTTPASDVAADVGGRLTQRLSGRRGDVSYTFGATAEHTAQNYDASGDLIPPDPKGQGGVANATGLNLFGKATFHLAPGEELTVSGTRYRFLQEEIGYRTVPGTPGEQKTTAEPGESRSEDVGNEHTALHARYSASDLLLGSSLEASVFLDRFTARYGWSGFLEAQSRIESEKEGARAHVSTPLGLTEGATLTWGADYLNDRTAQYVSDGRTFAPPIDQHSVGPFARVKVPVGERLTLRGGGRHEAIWLHVDDFTTIEAMGGNAVEGGDLSYSATVFDAGAVFHLTEQLDLFTSYSQGFSVTEVGRQLRGTRAESVEALAPEPKTTDHYEAGVRGRWPGLHFEVSAYENTSELGATFNEEFEIIRSPEEIRGLEASADVQPADEWKTGGSFTWTVGKHDADDDGQVDDPLPGFRISPVKVSTYVENVTLPGWKNRVQVQFVGERKVFPVDAGGFGQGRVDDYATVDLTSSLEVWRGTLRLGVKNVFNEFYFPASSQWLNFGYGYTAGTGRSVTLGYSVGW